MNTQNVLEQVVEALPEYRCMECGALLDDGEVIRASMMHRVPMRNHGPDSTYFCGPAILLVRKEPDNG